MASECMECVEGRAVALGLCADCLAGEPVEAVVRLIARLARELEEAHAQADALRRELADATEAQVAAEERERAVRDEATGYLAETAGTLADMHDGEECRFEGGEGCLACYAQGRIGEMQDALAARTTGEERER